MGYPTSRLEQWMKQGNVIISQLFFTHYRALQISDLEAMIVLHLVSFQAKGIDFPTPSEISERMEISDQQVAQHLQRLMQKGFLLIEKSTNEKMIEETYILYPLWERLIDQLEKIRTDQQDQRLKNETGELFRIFEEEFGRIFTPLEYETISKWLDEDGHPPEVIRQALVEAVLAEKKSLKYIDRILFEWKKKNLKTIQDVQKHAENFHKYTVKTEPVKRPTAKVPFYNWLEERE
ncbi:DnaD domain-containing protein [Chryseomicrobium palamuruense]|uniref:DnaD domain-containing protein n=1 Tax=Chryseomicrobium palamuruense TaxID=682973 RepID=A0ABV8UVN1_9BACL